MENKMNLVDSWYHKYEHYGNIINIKKRYNDIRIKHLRIFHEIYHIFYDDIDHHNLYVRDEYCDNKYDIIFPTIQIEFNNVKFICKAVTIAGGDRYAVILSVDSPDELVVYFDSFYKEIKDPGSYKYMEHFPEEYIYDEYKHNKRKFTLYLDNEYLIYPAMYFLKFSILGNTNNEKNV